jgi:hypothetical protein
MKKLLFFLSFLMITGMLNAQVKERSVSMSKGHNNAFVVQFKNAQAKEVSEVWEKYVKDFKTSAKKVKKSEELMADDAEIKEMSTNTVDIYSLAEQSGEDVTFYVWFDLGGAFLSSKMHPDRYPKAMEIMRDFEYEVDRDRLKKMVKEQEDILKDMEKELDGFQKDQKNEEDNIQKYKEKIAESEEKIREAIANQKETEVKVRQQQKLIETTEMELKKIGKKN